MWSKWQWVTRIASTVTPSSSIAARIRAASSPGSTTSARSEPSRLNRKQFSCTGPTVNIRTTMRGSVSAALPGPAGGGGSVGLAVALPLLAPLARPVEEPVHRVPERDVDEKHEGREAYGGARRLPQDQQQHSQEDERREARAVDRPTPIR